MTTHYTEDNLGITAYCGFANVGFYNPPINTVREIKLSDCPKCLKEYITTKLENKPTENKVTTDQVITKQNLEPYISEIKFNKNEQSFRVKVQHSNLEEALNESVLMYNKLATAFNKKNIKLNDITMPEISSDQFKIKPNTETIIEDEDFETHLDSIKTIPKTFGWKLRKFRKEKNIKGSYLAQHLGVSNGDYLLLETQSKCVTTLKEISLSIAEILELDDSEYAALKKYS